MQCLIQGDKSSIMLVRKRHKHKQWKQITPPQNLQYQKCHQLPIRTWKSWSIYTRHHTTRENYFKKQICLDSNLLWIYQVPGYLSSSHRHCSDKKTIPLFANSLGRKRYIALRLFDNLNNNNWRSLARKKRSSPRSQVNLQPEEQDSPSL